MMIALGLFAVHALLSFYMGASFFMSSTGAIPIDEKIHPQLFNVVEEMKIASGMPAMPKVYVIDSDAPNAFATGRNPEHAAIAVTSGLLEMCTRDELQAVVAHEIAHIMNRDTLYMTMLGCMVGVVVMLSNMFKRSMFHSRRSSRSRSGGGGNIIVFVMALVLMLLAPLAAYLLYYAASRTREYLADAGSAVYTRYPEALATALAKIAGSSQRLAQATRMNSPLFIVDPYMSGNALVASLSPDKWMATHPPTEKRIAVLRGMGGITGDSLAQIESERQVSFGDYDRVFSKVTGQRSIIPSEAYGLTSLAPASQPHSPSTSTTTTQDLLRSREVTDMLWSLEGYRFIECDCGNTLKLSPKLKRNIFVCPTCHTRHKL